MGKQCDNRLALSFMPKFDTNATTKLSSQAVVEVLKSLGELVHNKEKPVRNIEQLV